MALTINAQILRDLRTTLQAAFSKGMQSGKTFYQRIASVIPSNSSRNTYPDLSQWPAFRKWVGERQFKDLSATAYSIENETFEASVSVKREDIEDDNLGVPAHIAETSGMAALTFPDELIAELVSEGFVKTGYDGKPFFAATHMGKDGAEDQSNIVGNAADGISAILLCTTKPFKPFIVQPRREFKLTSQFDENSEAVFNRNVFEYGSDGRVGVGYGPWMLAVAICGELTSAKYAEARARMAGFVSTVGRKYSLRGDLLMVGSANEGAALEILTADKLTGGKSNIWKGTAEVMVNPYL